MLPKEWKNWKNLMKLDLRNNKFHGTVPVEWASFPVIQIILLDGNQFDNKVNENSLELLIPSYKLRNTERKILVELYACCNGINWNNKSNWNSVDTIVSIWHGVVVNDSYEVKSISLSANNLNGIIPASLFRLSKLQDLNLSNNLITGISIVCYMIISSITFT